MFFREFHKLVTIQRFFEKKKIVSEERRYKFVTMTKDILRMISKNEVSELQEYVYDYQDRDPLMLFCYLIGRPMYAMRKPEIYNMIEEYMMNLHESLATTGSFSIDPVDTSKLRMSFKAFLSRERLMAEADEDPFADMDEGGDEDSADTSSDSVDAASSDATVDNDVTVTDDRHADDPDFKSGNSDSLTYDQSAAATTIDFEKVLANLGNVIVSGSLKGFGDLPKFKTDIELISNGKKLLPEDIQFGDVNKVLKAIDAILKDVDDVTKNYFKRKLREPVLDDYLAKKIDAAKMSDTENLLLGTV